MKTDDYFKRYKRYYTFITPYLNNQKVKDYTYVILTFFTAAFFAYAAIKPTVQTIASLKRQLVDGKEADLKLQEKIRALSIGQETIASVGNDLLTIEGVIPTKPTVDFLVKQLENLAVVSSVKFNSLSFGTVPLKNGQNSNQVPKVNSELKDITISFSVIGNFENINSFLEKARGLRRLLVIGDVSIAKTKGSTEEKILSLTASTKSFYRN